MKRLIGVLLLIVILSWGTSCREKSHDQGGVPSDHHFVGHVKKMNQKEKISVQEVSDKTVRVKQVGQPEFFTLKRVEKIEKFACSQCHKVGKKPSKGEESELVHGGLEMKHGDEVMNCKTCHNEENLDSLVNIKGELISMDHPYRVCSQCHFEQFRDWKGGAHGKRLTYWTGRRVIFNCTDCHNPHHPQLEKRLPKTYSRPVGSSR